MIYRQRSARVERTRFGFLVWRYIGVTRTSFVWRPTRASAERSRRRWEARPELAVVR